MDDLTDRLRGATGNLYPVRTEVAVALNEAADTIDRLTQERDAARAEALEEAAKVADKHYQESKKSAAYYKSLPDDDGSYGQCLADMIVAGDIAARIRAMEDRPEGHYYRGRIDEAKSIARAINAIMPYSRDPAALAHGKLHRELARDHVDEVEHLRAVNAQVVAILTEAVVAHGPLGDDARPSWWAKANAALSGNPKCCRGLAPLPECACAQWEAQEEYARRRGVKNVLPHPFPDAPETKKTPATP